MTKMRDFVGQTFINKNDRKFKVIAYNGRDRIDTVAYKHFYEIQFLVSKNKYIVDRNQIKNGTAKDLDVIALENKLKKEAKRKERAKMAGKGNTYEYKKFYFKDKIVLGLDLSTSFTGWCATKNGNILKYGGITFENKHTKEQLNKIEQFKEIELIRSKDNWRERVNFITEYLDKYIKASDIILVEDTQFQTSALIYAKLCELRGFVLSRCFFYDKDFEVIPAGTWRKAHNFRGLLREELKEEAISNFEKVIGRKYPFDDIAESYFISTAGAKVMQK